MRAGIYLRQSVDRHGDELAVSRQREDCRKLCTDRGWLIVDEFTDNDTSATRGVRPQYARMLDAIRAGHLDAVVSWDLDRLHRRPAELEEFITLADEHRIALATVGGDADLSTDSGRLFARIKGAVARAEIERKATRQKRAGLQRAQNGLPWGPRRPFGYEPGGMDLNELEATLIRTAYADLIAGGSLRGIAAGWSATGVLTSTGATWRAEQVHQMLRNPRYAGLRSYGRGQEIVGPAAWPSIVDEATWRTAHAILTDPSRRVGVSRGRLYLLTGIVLCGRCGRPMGSGRATSTGARTYVCRKSMHLSRAGEPVDLMVREVVVNRLSSPDALDLLANEDRPDTVALHAEAVALRRRLDDVATEFADGALTASQLRTITKRVRARLDEAESQMISASRAPVLGSLIGRDDVGERFDALDLDKRRAVVDALVSVAILPAGRGRGFKTATVIIESARNRQP